MAFSLNGGVAVVTGAASGIGAALAAVLAQRGAHLALVDRNETALNAVVASVRTPAIVVSEHVHDLADTASLAGLAQTILAAHGRISLLVNNAGVAIGGTFEQIALDDMAWLFAINFWAPVHLTRAFLPALRREQAAHIVNISSVYGLVAPPGQAAYCAAKFALRGFSEALRHELAGSSVTLTCVHPGGVRTEIANQAKLPPGTDPVRAADARHAANALLRKPPAEAAALIVHAIEHRAPRLLIGGDAKLADLLQRLSPARYWRIMERRAAAGRKG